MITTGQVQINLSTPTRIIAANKKRVLVQLRADGPVAYGGDNTVTAAKGFVAQKMLQLTDTGEVWAIGAAGFAGLVYFIEEA